MRRSVSHQELKTGFAVVTHITGGQPLWGLLCHPGRLFHLLDDTRWHPVFFEGGPVTDIEAITATGVVAAEAACGLQVFATRHQRSVRRRGPGCLIDVKRVARQLQDLEPLPHYSPLRFLGYFAILESLLTHPPKLTDPYDSITRQVKKQVSLLACCRHRAAARQSRESFCG